MPYYKHILPYGLAKFKRYAVNVWGISAAGKTDEQVACEGLAAMEAWMRKLGLVMDLTSLGVTEDMLDDLVKSTLYMQGGYKVLTPAEAREIFKESL